MKRKMIVILFFIFLLNKVSSKYQITFPCSYINKYHYYIFEDSGYYLIQNNYNNTIYIAILNQNEYQNFYYKFLNNYRPITFEADQYFILYPSQPFFLINVSSGNYLIYWPEGCNYYTNILIYYKGNNLPIGISTFENVKTSSIKGYFNIYNISPEYASLQLNVILVAKTLYGDYLYWVQNVLMINHSYYYFINNIWNFTNQDISYLNNEIILGKGSIHYYKDSGDYYVYSTEEYKILYPLEGYLELKIINYNPLTIQFIGYANGKKIIYDNVSIYVPYIIDAYFISKPYHDDRSSIFYNTEFVFGGPGESRNVYIKGLRAILRLEYYDSKINNYVPYSKYLYNYGFNTAETASNLNSLILENKSFVYVKNGEFIPFNSQSSNYNIINITLYYPNSTIYRYFDIFSGPIYIKIPIEILNNGTKYLYNGFSYVNDLTYYGNEILINNPGEYIIYPSYSTLYQLNISSKVPMNITYDSEFYKNVYYISKYVPEGSSVLVLLPKYYYITEYERYVCNETKINIGVYAPTDINLNNLCNIQYLVRISSQYPLKINGHLTNNYSEFHYPGDKIYIEGKEEFINGIFYYTEPIEIYVNGPLNIEIKFKVDYIKTLTLYIVIISIIIVSLYVYKKFK